MKSHYFIILILILTLLTGCQAKELHTQDNYYLYTHVEITTYGKLPDKIYHEIWHALDTIDHTMGMSGKNSEIVKINENAGTAPVIVSETTFNVIKQALDYSEINDAFDITIGPLVALWGIGTDNAQIPSEQKIKQTLNRIDHQSVILNDTDKSVFLKNVDMAIDLGAIAKGYAADLTRDILLKHNIKKAIVNYGGNILTLGEKSAGTPWKIGVQNPDQQRGAYMGVVSLVDKTIVTSGTYERFLEKDGKLYHHILSTKDGYPIDNQLWSVSIITDKSIDGDALSTLVFALGKDAGLELVENMPNTECIMITNDRNVYLSSGLKNNFVLADDSFSLVE